MTEEFVPTPFILKPESQIPPRRRVGPFVRGQAQITIPDWPWGIDAALAEAWLLICNPKAKRRLAVVAYYDRLEKLQRQAAKAFNGLGISKADVTGELHLLSTHTPLNAETMAEMAEAVKSAEIDLLIWQRHEIDWADLDAIRKLAHDTGAAVSVYVKELLCSAEDAALLKARTVSRNSEGPTSTSCRGIDQLPRR